MSVVNRMLKDLEKQNNNHSPIFSEDDDRPTAVVCENSSNITKVIFIFILLIAISLIIFFNSMGNNVPKDYLIADSKAEVVKSKSKEFNINQDKKTNVHEPKELIANVETKDIDSDNPLKAAFIVKKDINSSSKKLTENKNNKVQLKVVEHQVMSSTPEENNNESDNRRALDNRKIHVKTVVTPKSNLKANDSQAKGIDKENVKSYSQKELKKLKLEKATALIEQGLLGKAEEALREIVDEFPAFHQANEHLAYVYLETSNDSSLERFLEEKITQYPSHRNYRALLIRHFAEKKQWTRVIALANDSEINNEDIRLMKAIAFQQLNQHDEAIDVYVDLLKSNKERGDWWLGLSISLESKKRFRDAYQALSKASGDPRINQQQHRYLKQKLRYLEGLL
ncbi:tetratricopeptide repeat protein [Pleionea sediminis]|uniref:tetratricopeptide repeat protein n=1 Tax=Pleionea sediminis TaxID=2569479 RepID=UPI001185ED41|nr:tetratricopeptide repeat protein [Pleionea sediminis]